LTRPVIVGVDGSEASLAAVDLAAREAVWRSGTLVVVHADAGRPGHAEPSSRWAAGARRDSEAQHEMLEAVAARARAAHPGLSVGARLCSGDTAQVLHDRSRGACLLVVGHQGRGLARLGVGSVALTVVDEATVPVIVHRPFDTSTDVASPRPVLVGVDTTPASLAVVEFGFVEASLRGAPLHAMYVWSEHADEEPPELRPERSGFAQAQDQAERMLAEAIAGWAEKYPDVVVRRTVRHSLDPAAALTAESRSAQLVVVGTSRRSRLSRLLMGSVRHALVHRAGCPVVVVPTDTNDEPINDKR
jgi:nucleotide-binding universal stress UspA family protein